MAKQTLDQKITKIEDAIIKEELIIEESKEKLKKLRYELKALKSEKEKAFANEIIEMIKNKGISHEKLIADLNAVLEKKETSEELYKSSTDHKITEMKTKDMVTI